jgi:uncharacterized protein
MIRSPFHYMLHTTIGVALILGFVLCQPVMASTGQSAPQVKQSGGFSPLDLYQRFISGADGQRCPMYPSCSHYARQSFEKHGFIKGWIITSDRLLRCGRDETRLSRQQHGGAYDPLEANTFWWDKKTK